MKATVTLDLDDLDRLMRTERRYKRIKDTMLQVDVGYSNFETKEPSGFKSIPYISSDKGISEKALIAVRRILDEES